MKDSLARTWGQVGPDGRRQRRRATGATALWLAATTLALAGAGALCAATDIGGAAGPALTAGPADLLVRLAYRASEPSRLRFYRGTSLDELVSVGEYAIRRSGTTEFPVVSFDAEMVDVATGFIVWRISITETGKGRLPIIGGAGERTFARVTQEACRRAVRVLREKVL